MIMRNILAAIVAAVALLTTSGCAVSSGQETVGAYVDDTTITIQVKSANEKATAKSIARKVSGVKSIKNEIAVRP